MFEGVTRGALMLLAILMFLVGVGAVIGGYAAVDAAAGGARGAGGSNQRLRDLSAPLTASKATRRLVKRDERRARCRRSTGSSRDSKAGVRSGEAHRAVRRQDDAERDHRHEPRGVGRGRRAGDQHPGARWPFVPLAALAARRRPCRSSVLKFKQVAAAERSSRSSSRRRSTCCRARFAPAMRSRPRWAWSPTS